MYKLGVAPLKSVETDSRILVVLPTLGERIDSLRETLDSIDEQRSDVHFSLVVVSPESAFEARALSSKYGAKLVNDPKTGISDAINCGISAKTTEEYYAWMGDDDLFRPGSLKTLLQMLDANPDAVVSYGACDYIDPTGKIIGTNKAGKLAQYLLSWGPDLIPHPGSMIRLSALETVGGFDSNLRFAMDLDVFLKLKKIGRFVATKCVTSAFRWHPDSLTVSNRKKSSLESEKVKAKYLPSGLRPFSFIWVFPIRWASAIASSMLSRRA